MLAAKGTGTTFSAISKGILNSHEIPVAPLNEQLRIVEKIETLFARLDKGEEALRDVQKLLARYRQSVLKAAVTGQLTVDWRAENAHRLEPGQDLLARILQTRRETWDGRGKYKEPTGPDTTDLPELPKGWVWTSLGALISKGPQNGLYLPQSIYGTGTPILRIDDYQVDWLRPVQELRLVAAEAEDCDKYCLRHGDFVVNRVNSVSHLGKTTLLPFEYEGAIFESNMMRFSVSDQISREYLNLYLTSDLGRKRLIKNCKHAVNQASINQGDVEATPVPLPPRLEQEEIAQRVAEESSREIAGLKTCQTELARSAALRQSILKDAFAGRLVPQDPTDEPAAALLARIKETRAAAPGGTRRRIRA
ncbi:restriction endonuclease subunit S [Pelagibacterium montanilacus]|uniref:restriction endonuclease subunit S n=1 Tax=Pelagibacterium montanilacus TaxID=2185280 RepID=UPI000F8CDEBE|nr:restriction endonuclease subunit S [Pelagibacterium montanilacus]